MLTLSEIKKETHIEIEIEGGTAKFILRTGMVYVEVLENGNWSHHVLTGQEINFIYDAFFNAMFPYDGNPDLESGHEKAIRYHRERLHGKVR